MTERDETQRRKRLKGKAAQKHPMEKRLES